MTDQDTAANGAARGESPLAQETPTPLPAAGQKQGDGSPQDLLTRARAEIDKETAEPGKGDLRAALDCVDRYRDWALAEEPQRILDTVSVLRSIERLGSRSIRDDARQFAQTTAARLASYPELAQQYETALLQAELDDVEGKRSYVGAKLLPMLGLAASVAGVVALVLGSTRDDIGADVTLGGAIALPAGLLFAGIAFVAQRARLARLDAEAESIRRKLNLRTLRTAPTMATTDNAPSTPGGEYFGSLVRINVDNLSDYYAQVRVHTNNSFWASIAAGALGFLLIAVGLGIGFSDTSNDQAESLSFVATASGVIVEFISGVFFYLYNRTVRQLKEYHDSLLDVQNILLSFRIVEQSEAAHRGALFEQILQFLLQKRAEAQLAESPK